MDKKVLKLSVTNCYLINIGKKYLLIDTGYEADWEVFRKRLDEMGVSLSEISAILLTHHHDDHCGLLNRVLKENPEIRVVMSIRAKDFLPTGKNDRTHGGKALNKRVSLLISLFKAFDRRWKTHSFPPYQAREKDILVNGDTNLKDIGIGLDGRIIETPGHTTDSISVVLADGDCVVGDAAANFPPFLGTKYCVIMVEDLEAYYQSWEKLAFAGARQIFPAHGEAFPADMLAQNSHKNSERHLVPLS